MRALHTIGVIHTTTILIIRETLFKCVSGDSARASSAFDSQSPQAVVAAFDILHVQTELHFHVYWWFELAGL